MSGPTAEKSEVGTKFTAGPWKILAPKNSTSAGIVPVKPAKGIPASQVEDIAQIDLMGEQYDAMANLRLMAAAPDLLDIAIRLVAMYDCGMTRSRLEEAVFLAREAIRKATGVANA